MKWISGLTLAIGLSMSSAASGQGNTIACGQSYTVASGDSLAAIALRAYNTPNFEELYRENAATIGPNPNLLAVGQTLRIPCRDGTGARAEVVTLEEAAERLSQAEARTGDALVLTFNKTSGPKFIMNQNIIDLYLAQITEVTEGRVRFVDPPVINREEEAQFELVASGQVDGAYVVNSLLADSHPLLQLPMLPLMGGSAEQTATALWRLHADYLSRTNYFEDAVLLGFIGAPAAHIWRAKSDPVRPDEGIAYTNVYPVPYFDGLDQRGPVALQQEVSAFEATYAQMHVAPPAYFLAHGAARAVGVWTDEIKVTEVDNGLYTPTFSVILSNAAWARISEEDQAAILSISGERLAARSASWDAFDNGFRADMLANGLLTEKASGPILQDLQARTDEGIKAWSAKARAMGLPAALAVAAYEQNLRALQDRLIFR